jgi:hypothetical protein
LCLTLAPKSAQHTSSRSLGIPACPSGSGQGGGTRLSSVEPTSCGFLLLLDSLQLSSSLSLSFLSSPRALLAFTCGCGRVTCLRPRFSASDSSLLLLLAFATSELRLATGRAVSTSRWSRSAGPSVDIEPLSILWSGGKGGIASKGARRYLDLTAVPTTCGNGGLERSRGWASLPCNQPWSARKARPRSTRRAVVRFADTAESNQSLVASCLVLTMDGLMTRKTKSGRSWSAFAAPSGRRALCAVSKSR